MILEEDDVEFRKTRGTDKSLAHVPSKMMRFSYTLDIQKSCFHY